MAQNLVLNILARDKTRQAFNGIRAGLSNLRASIFSVQSALIGIGGGLVVRSFINVGREVEELGIRFNFLFGNVEEGQKAFKAFKYRVPSDPSSCAFFVVLTLLSKNCELKNFSKAKKYPT